MWGKFLEFETTSGDLASLVKVENRKLEIYKEVRLFDFSGPLSQIDNKIIVIPVFTLPMKHVMITVMFSPLYYNNSILILNANGSLHLHKFYVSFTGIRGS